MKPSVCLFLLSLCSIAHAAEPRVIADFTLDYDGDKKPDRIRVLDIGAKDFYTLEFTQSTFEHNGKNEPFTYDTMVHRPFSDYSEEDQAQRNECMDVKSNKFSVTKFGTFVWEEVSGDFDGCNKDSMRTLYIHGYGLNVIRVEENAQEFHAGDPAPWSKVVYDFIKMRIYRKQGDMHFGSESRSGSVKIPSFCIPGALGEEVPMCARAREQLLHEKLDQ